ncbi:unnamed protein product, partial [Ectocarpus fasciculatus]
PSPQRLQHDKADQRRTTAGFPEGGACTGWGPRGRTTRPHLSFSTPQGQSPLSLETKTGYLHLAYRPMGRHSVSPDRRVESTADLPRARDRRKKTTQIDYYCRLLSSNA